MNQDLWKTSIISKKEIAKDMVEIRLKKPEGFSFLAGQFIQFSIPTSAEATEGKSDVAKIAKRAYSIASHPSADYLEFCIKMLPGGLASTYFQKADETTEILFSGPQGRFICDNAEDKPFYFVATGAGLGPIIGIISDELHNKKNTVPTHLLFGVRSEEDLFWTDRLDALASEYPHFSYTLALSQPQQPWTGSVGRVTDHMPAQTADTHFYLCGSPDMVKDVREVVLSRGGDPSTIHFEVF